MRVDVLAAGMAIVKSAFATYACTPIHVSTCGEMYGIISKTLISQSMDKPLLDVLGYSLSSINEFYPTGKCMSNVYDIAIILYRQLKVLHKLSRTFLKNITYCSKYEYVANAYLSTIMKKTVSQ